MVERGFPRLLATAWPERLSSFCWQVMDASTAPAGLLPMMQTQGLSRSVVAPLGGLDVPGPPDAIRDATKTSASQVRLVAFLFPWIGGVAEALLFPESGPIANGDLDSLQPLGTFVKVAIGDQGAHRGAMLLR